MYATSKNYALQMVLNGQKITFYFASVNTSALDNIKRIFFLRTVWNPVHAVPLHRVLHFKELELD